MQNLKETIEDALTKKGVSARKMLQDLGINEPTYYRGLKKNSMKTGTFNKICDYLEIENLEPNNTNTNATTVNNMTEYWKGLFDQFSKEITELRMENWNLKKELGKFSTVSLQPCLVNN